ncbi:hypothetical protein [Paenibacillus silagei]|uniref:HEAT repeat domain-containing protein n=1 Tax=Paenibacillus silagei TaxID=1670801 RepID=A0ABS4NLT6_9BACL|nr:hypothetical protein [Paenibacillus silagei]MBP2110350.1 hypothetical protein [Paenibacillus silagei]
MRREELYREIGQIDDALIEAAEHSGAKGRVRRSRFSKRWIVLVACLIVYSSTATALLATEYTKNKAAEPYIRYLTAEDMELAPPVKYEADKFLQALASGNDEHVYIAVNRLVESFNDPQAREQALKKLQPFLTDDSPRIAESAAFAIDVLSKSYRSPYLHKMADGSIIFALFNNYSDYGTQNVLWRIKDDVLEPYFSFAAPSMYIKEILPSPDRKLLAVVTSSNKSEFVQILDVEKGTISPELVESARIRHGAQRKLEAWTRSDHENYSYADQLAWKDNDTLAFEGSLSYRDTEIIENVAVTYRFKDKVMEVQPVK